MHVRSNTYQEALAVLDNERQMADDCINVAIAMCV